MVLIKLISDTITKPKFFFGFISLIAFIGLIAFGLFVLFTEYASSKVRIVSTTKMGALTITINDNVESANFLLSPNGTGNFTPWVSTGIKLNKNDKISFSVSGKVCTGFHKMVSAARVDSLPPLPWNGYEGIDKEQNKPPRDYRKKEIIRKKFLIAPNYSQGKIIGIITFENKPVERPINKDIINISKFRSDSYYEVEDDGFLWLTVNDVWLDKVLLDTIKPEEINLKSEKINYIIEKEYWNLWYDDNAGFFSVLIEVKK